MRRQPWVADRAVTPDGLYGAMQTNVHLLGLTLSANVVRAVVSGRRPAGVAGPERPQLLPCRVGGGKRRRAAGPLLGPGLGPA